MGIWLFALAACGSDGGSASGPGGTGPAAVLGCAPNCPVEDIASTAERPHSLVVTGEQVLFAVTGGKDRAGIYSVRKQGGEPPRKLVSSDLPGDARCKLVATDGTYVYFAGSQVIERVPLGGGPIEQPSPGATPNLGCVALDDAYLYYVGVLRFDPAPQSFWRFPKAGGRPQRIADAPSVQSFVVRRGTLYFASNTQVGSIPVAGGVPKILAGQIKFGNHRIDADDAFVYSADRSTNVVFRVPVGGGAQEIIASEQEAYGLIVDGGAVYWSHRPNDAAENRIMLLGNPHTEIGGVPIVKAVGAVDLAADGTHLYWVSESENAIRRTTK
jgi:hypothetical protein